MAQKRHTFRHASAALTAFLTLDFPGEQESNSHAWARLPTVPTTVLETHEKTAHP